VKLRVQSVAKNGVKIPAAALKSFISFDALDFESHNDPSSVRKDSKNFAYLDR
jgi:hypothetical protein